jgi:hypothetical protein
MDLRVHRAISWIGRAEKEIADPDAAFIFLWIGFNAAYADETDLSETPLSERQQFRDLLSRIVELDTDARLHSAIWQRFQGPVRQLMQNKYIFRPFWMNLNAVPGHDDWIRKFRASAERFRRAMIDQDTARVLSIVFDRLYVLRCQMMHGATTWNGRVNRGQVEDGAALLGVLLPIMIDTMLDHPEEDWGRPFYPVVGADSLPTAARSEKIKGAT